MARAARVTICLVMASAPASLLARLRALPPARFDLLLGAAVLVEGCIEVLALSRLEGARVLLGVLVVAMVAAAAALRRRVTLFAVGLGWSAMLVADQVGPEFLDNVVSPYFVNMFVTFTAGYVFEGRRLWLAAALGIALATLSTATDGYENEPSSFLFAAGLGVMGPLVLGQLLRNRTRLNEALRDKAVRLETERAQQAESAALEERTRIAGELHDVVAHALSAMTVQAGAARRLAARDPERARAAFETAETTGREALTELRRLLGVLRREDEDLALAPQPSLAHVNELIRRSTTAGLPTRLRTEGDRRPLPAAVDLTAYRLVQEALSAARARGGAGRAEVAIRYGQADVVVQVSDDGTDEQRRLLGMDERVAVCGGELTAARAPAGGWSVAARLPLEARP